MLNTKGNQLNSILLFTFLTMQLILSIGTQAQNLNSIDSLKEVLLHTTDDSTKLKISSTLFTQAYKTGNYKEGLIFAQQSLILAQKLKDERGLADACNNIGLVYDNMDLRDSALIYFYKSLALRDTVNSKKQISATYGNIANLYKSRGDYISALKNNLVSLKLKQEIGDSSGMAITYNNIGLVYFNQKNYLEAISNYEKSIAISGRLNNKRNMAMTANNFGTVYQNLNQYDSAIFWLNKAIEFNTELGNKSWLSKNFTNLGNAYNNKAVALKKAGNLEGYSNYNQKSLSAFEESLKRLKPDENKDDYLAVCNSICELYINSGKLLAAENYCQKSLKLLPETDNIKLKQETLEFSGLLYSELAAVDSIPDSVKVIYLNASLAYYSKANKLKDQRLNEDNTKQIAEMKTKFDVERKDSEIKLLGKENELKSAGIKQRDFALQLAFLEKEKNQDAIVLLNKNTELQSLQLQKTQQELNNRNLQTAAKTAELALAKKDKALKKKQFNEQILYRNLIAVSAISLIIFGLLLFNRFRLRKQLESQKALVTQRKQISADLHDDIGATLSSISIYSEALKSKYQQGDHANAISLAEKIGTNSREMMDNMSDIVWAINPGHDSLQQLFDRMSSFASTLLAEKNIQSKFYFDEALFAFSTPMEVRKNIYLIFKECINNIAKYASCKNVNVEVEKKDDLLVLNIKDDGKGFEVSSMNALKNQAGMGGNGIKNMKQRAHEIDASLEIISEINKGTTVILKYHLIRG